MRIFLVLLIIISSVSLTAQEIWKITSLDWQPYSGAALSNQGNSIQKLREILSQEDIRLIVEFYPWKRAKEKAKSEEFIGFFPAWPEEVTDGFVASLPVDWSEIGILKRKDVKVEFLNYADLFKQYKVGLIDTYEYPEEINRAKTTNSKNVILSPNEVSLLKQLSNGRCDLALTDPNVMLYLASSEGIDNIESIDQGKIQKELVISLRNDKENAKRIELLNKILGK